MTGEPQTPELAITTKANLIFAGYLLFTRTVTPKTLYSNYGAMLEGRKTNLIFEEIKIVRLY